MRINRLVILLLLCAVGFAAARTTSQSPAAEAATGDNLRSFTAAVAPCGIGTGLAFDGTKIYLSCWGSNALREVSTADGSSLGTLTLSGVTDLGAMAWDSSRNKLWVCQGGSQAYLADLTSLSAQLKFNVPGCIDGLAYDGADDTLWVSPDVSSTVYHYKTDGSQIASFPVSGKIGGCGNSGIAVGGDKLYLSNDGCSQIYQCTKTLSSCTLMSTFPRRLEDLECDNRTFAGKNAIWSKDAYDNTLNAWEIPLGSCNAGGKPAPGKDDRVVIFVQGITSESSCPDGNGFLDQAPKWLQPFLTDPQQPWIQNAVHISGFVYFSYSGAYCDGSTGEAGGAPNYAKSDTCAGFDEVYYDRLKGLIERVTDRFKDRKTRVSIVAHSQGGLIASYLVARLRKDAPDFLAQRVASVITFDSFPEGLPFADITRLWPPYWSPCGLTSANIQDWDQNSYVSQTARDAAQPFDSSAGPKCPGRDQACVKFYTIDAASGPVAEQWTHIRGESNHAQYPGDHSQIWDDELLGKQRFVGCGVILWDSCTFWEARVSQGQRTQSQMIVGPSATQLRVTSNFGSVVRMTLTSPDGTIYGPDGSGPAAAYGVTETSETYDIDNPAPGNWSVVFDGIEVPHPEGEDVTVALLVDGLVNAPPTLAVPGDQSVQYSDYDILLERALQGGNVSRTLVRGCLFPMGGGTRSACQGSASQRPDAAPVQTSARRIEVKRHCAARSFAALRMTAVMCRVIAA